MERKIVKVCCIISHHCINGITLRLSGLKDAGINYKKLPQYATIEIDLNSIKEREKGTSLKELTLQEKTKPTYEIPK